MKLNFQWRENEALNSSGECLYINRIRVGEYFWNSTRSKSDKDDTTNWTASLTLPALKFKRLYAGSPDEIKLKIERIVTGWFEEALKE